MTLRRKLIVFAMLGVVVLGAIIASQRTRHSGATTASTSDSSATGNPTSQAPRSLAELLDLQPDQIAQCDVARMNLLCAEGLRGSQGLNVDATIARLDAWAYHVESEIKRNHHRFQNNPQDYENSEAYYRMIMLATVLQQDFGTRYSPERASPQLRGEHEPSDQFFGDSKDVFIHGLIGGEHFGTCSSLPVLYLAVAQRLGYPVNLASAQGHLYVRYEEGDIHLNVEATTQGFTTYTDDHYRQWPRPISGEEEKTYGMLRPKTKAEILGAFLTIRAGCLTSMKRFDEAADAWAQAARYLPPTPVLAKLVERAQQRAKNERASTQWDRLWEEVAGLAMPQGEKIAYFSNKRVQLQLLMNQSTDIAAIEDSVREFIGELAAHWKASGLGQDSVPLHLPVGQNSSIAATLQLSPDMDVLLPFDPQQPRVALREERVPPEFVKSIPPELQERLQGLANEEHIITEMWAFHAETLNRRNRERMPSPVRGTSAPARDILPQSEVNRHRAEEARATLLQPFEPGRPNSPLMGPPVRIDIIPANEGKK